LLSFGFLLVSYHAYPREVANYSYQEPF